MPRRSGDRAEVDNIVRNDGSEDLKRPGRCGGRRAPLIVISAAKLPCNLSRSAWRYLRRSIETACCRQASAINSASPAAMLSIARPSEGPRPKYRSHGGGGNRAASAERPATEQAGSSSRSRRRYGDIKSATPGTESAEHLYRHHDMRRPGMGERRGRWHEPARAAERRRAA